MRSWHVPHGVYFFCSRFAISKIVINQRALEEPKEASERCTHPRER